jgi:hypothetical protein
MAVKTRAQLSAQFLGTDPADQMNDLRDATLASAASIIPPVGTWRYVDGTNGVDTNAGTLWTAPLKTITAGLAAMTTAKHDVLALMAAVAGTSELAAIDWTHNFSHLVGLGAPTGIAQRTRIVCGAKELSPFFTVSGYGNLFSNLYFWQGQDDADSLINVKVSGNRNYFQNVHFAGGGHATQAIDGGASLLVSGSENLFRRCVIGVDSVVAAAGMANLLFDSYATRNVFEDCIFQIYAGATTVKHVEVVDNIGLDRWNLFKNCLFINSCRTYTLAEVFTIPAAMASVTNYLILNDCDMLGSLQWESAGRDVVVGF